MKKLVIGSMIGMALLSACASHGARPGSHGTVVRFVPLGGLAGNAYGLAYQTCRNTGVGGLARDVHAVAVQPQAAADAFVVATFSAKARPFATRGCLDGLSGRPATPPTKRTAAKP